MKLLAISGSLNAASSNSALLQALRRVASPHDDIAIYELLDDIPHFSPDRERGTPPVAVSALRAAMRAADAVVIATPEYAGGMPGVLKNGLDWLVGSGELYGKATVVVSAAPSEQRGHHARAWLEQTLRMQGAHVCDSFTVAVARDQGGDAFVASARDVLARARGALLSGSCAQLVPTAPS